MTHLAHIWRHPLKSHGREQLEQVFLTAGQTMPWDRKWAVAHDASKATDAEWSQCANFSRGSKAPQLMAITAKTDTQTGALTLSHPNRPDITFDPATDSPLFLEWVKPLMPENRAQSERFVCVPQRGMTDTPYPSISINNLASLSDLASKMDQDIDMRRWRGNLWVDGFDAWSEFDWIGKEVQIGDAVFEICDPIKRCLATTADPDTGERNADTLGALKTHWGHQDFGVYAQVIRSGDIKLGDQVKVLS